jgi:TolA-binding protein
VPATILLFLAASRLLALPPEDREPVAQELYERASRAFADGRHSDAAEYLRHATGATGDPDLRSEMLCLRGESLLRAGRPDEAAASFERTLDESPQGPHAAQALFGLAEAQAASDRESEAAETRRRLRLLFPETPWAARVAI